MCGAPSTILHLDNTVAELRRSPASVEQHHRHHAVVLTKLSLDTLLDQEFKGCHRAERVQNSEVPCVWYLDRSEREDVRLHQPRCVNASAFGLRGYVDNTVPSRCVCVGIFLKLLRSPTVVSEPDFMR